jgi:hypothetical protein
MTAHEAQGHSLRPIEAILGGTRPHPIWTLCQLTAPHPSLPPHTHAHSTPDPRPTAFLAIFRLPRHGDKVQTRPESPRRLELSVPARPGPFVQTDWADLGRGGSCGGL